MNRTRVRRRRTVFAVAGVLVAGAWAGPVAGAVMGGSAHPVTVSRSDYVVRTGDTLWSIARRVAPGEDPRAIVDAISRANGVTADSLVPGQALVIPSA